VRIAVTGSTGRVGNHVVRRPTATASHEVIGLTRSVAPYEDVLDADR
jgi:nucleoside-diphosphate-sugar epimerase